MSSLRSLIVKIGADDADITKALHKLGGKMGKTAADMQKIGGSPLGQQAIASFESMQKAMQGVTDAQQRLADKASNTARGLEVIGGVSKVTERELAILNRTVLDGISAYQALGQQAPKELQKVADAISQRLAKPTEGLNSTFGGVLSTVSKFAGAVGIGFSVGAVVSFGKSLLADADALVKLSDKTGITIEGLQRLQVAGDDAGNTIDDITTAVAQMENRVAGGDSSAVGAIGKLGLNFQTFKSLDPESQFLAISDALRQIQNPAEQVNIAMDLFGKQGANVLPTLKRGFDDLKDASVGMSAETARNLDAVGDAFARLERAAKGHIANAVVEIGKLGNTYRQGRLLSDVFFANDLPEQLDALTKSIKPAGQAMAQLPPIIAPTGEALAHMNARLDEAREAMNKATEAAKKIAAENQRFRDSVVVLTSSSIGAVHAFGAYGALLPELTGDTGLWREELDTLSSHSLPDLQTKLQNIGKDAGRSFSEAVDATKGFKDALKTSLDRVPDIFRDAFTGAGGVVGALKGILIDLGSSLGKMFSTSLAKSLTANRPSTSSFVGPLQEGQSNGFGDQAAGTGAAVGGAALAAHFAPGAAAAGGIGIGLATAGITLGISAAIVGGIALYKKLHKTEAQKLGVDIGRDLGVNITAEMAKAFEDDSKAFGRQATELLHLNDIIQAGGGLNTQNYDRFAGKLHDVFSLIETHQLTIAQGTASIDQNFSAMAAQGTDSFGFLDDKLKEIIRLNEKFGTQSKEIADYLKAQGMAAVNATNDVLKGSAAAATTSQQLQDLGTIALSTFAAAVASGSSFSEALAAASPGLDQLSAGFDRLGISVDNTALKTLLLQSTILKGNPDLLTAIGGLGSAFVALDNMGLLTTDTFEAMERTGLDTYTRLQGAVAGVGGTTRDALLPMQDYLHKAFKAASDLGIPLDDATQILIDQSKELGIWKDAGLTAADKQMKAFDRLIDRMGDFIDALNGVPPRRTVDIDVNTHYNDPGLPDVQGAATGGRVTAHGIQHFAGGGRVLRFQPRGTDTVPAMLTPGEVVLTRNQQQAVSSAISAKSGADISALDTRLASIERLLKTQAMDSPHVIARAVRDEVQKVPRRA